MNGYQSSLKSRGSSMASSSSAVLKHGALSSRPPPPRPVRSPSGSLLPPGTGSSSSIFIPRATDRTGGPGTNKATSQSSVLQSAMKIPGLATALHLITGSGNGSANRLDPGGGTSGVTAPGGSTVTAAAGSSGNGAGFPSEDAAAGGSLAGPLSYNSSRSFEGAVLDTAAAAADSAADVAYDVSGGCENGNGNGVQTPQPAAAPTAPSAGGLPGGTAAAVSTSMSLSSNSPRRRDGSVGGGGGGGSSLSSSMSRDEGDHMGWTASVTDPAATAATAGGRVENNIVSYGSATPSLAVQIREIASTLRHINSLRVEYLGRIAQQQQHPVVVAGPPAVCFPAPTPPSLTPAPLQPRVPRVPHPTHFHPHTTPHVPHAPQEMELTAKDQALRSREERISVLEQETSELRRSLAQLQSAKAAAEAEVHRLRTAAAAAAALPPRPPPPPQQSTLPPPPPVTSTAPATAAAATAASPTPTPRPSPPTAQPSTPPPTSPPPHPLTTPPPPHPLTAPPAAVASAAPISSAPSYTLPVPPPPTPAPLPPPSPPPPPPRVPEVVVSYRSAWSQAYLHFNVDGRGWTAVPGLRMEAAGPKEYSMRVQGRSIEFVVTNGQGEWDSPAGGGPGHNYLINIPGEYRLHYGALTQTRPWQ